MRVWRCIGAALLLLGGAPMAVAADMALILGDIGQVAALRDDTPVEAVDFAGPLREAGFEVTQPKNRSSGNMRLAAQRVEAALVAGQVDRLVIVVMGPVASSGRESWALSNGAAGASTLNIGVTGIPIGALSDMARLAHGPAVILISPGREVTTLGNGLTSGVQDLRYADGVTYGIGPAASLATVLSDGFLIPGHSMAEVARMAPDEVRFGGHLVGDAGLMGLVSAD